MEVKTSTEIFLKDLHVENISEKSNYILHEEFKKTPKNTNWKVVIILTIMVGALGAATIGISQWIAARNIITDYNLDEFQDVDLMSVLSQVNKLEKRKEESERELLILRRDYRGEISKIENTFNQEKTLLESKGYSEPLFEERLTGLVRLRDQDLKRVDEYYNNEIILKEEEVNLFKEQIKEFDSDKIQQAQEYENIMANEERKFKLEMDQLIEKYKKQLQEQDDLYTKEIDELLIFQAELKKTLEETGLSDMLIQKELYNPKIPEENYRLKKAVNSSINKTKYIERIIQTNTLLLDDGIIDPVILNSFEREISEWNTLINFIEGIPYENAVPEVITQLDSRFFKIIEKLGGEIINLSNVNREYINDILNQLSSHEEVLKRYKLFYQLQKESFSHQIELLGGGDGFIIKSMEDKIFYAYMDPYLEFRDGSIAKVYNSNNQFVGDIKLTKSGLLYQITLLKDDTELSVYNKIFIKRGNN